MESYCVGFIMLGCCCVEDGFCLIVISCGRVGFFYVGYYVWGLVVWGFWRLFWGSFDVMYK